MKHLFIGGGGLVGNAACNLAQEMGLDWRATTREDLDLTRINFSRLPVDVDIVYLIAAIRSISDCDRDPTTSRRINADAPIALARFYNQAGAFIIFVSSDYAEYGIAHYAIQKRSAEDFMRTIDAAIIRPGRISNEKAHEFARCMLWIGDERRPGLYNWTELTGLSQL